MFLAKNVQSFKRSGLYQQSSHTLIAGINPFQRIDSVEDIRKKITLYLKTFNLVGPQGTNYISEAQMTVLVHTMPSVNTSNMGMTLNAGWLHHKRLWQFSAPFCSFPLSSVTHSLICKTRKTSLSTLCPS